MAGDVVHVGEATVITPNLAAYNGVVHLIDAVLAPPALETTAADAAPADAAPADTTSAEAAETETEAAPLIDLFQHCERRPCPLPRCLRHSRPLAFADVLKEAGPFTVFAPSDDAFAALPEGTLDALLADPARLAAVLKYHVVSGGITVESVADGMNAATLEGKPLTFALEDGAIYVNGAEIVTPDLFANNGVIHEIDQVSPACVDEQAAGGAPAAASSPTAPAVRTLLDAANEAGQFKTLAAAVAAVGTWGELARRWPLHHFCHG